MKKAGKILAGFGIGLGSILGAVVVIFVVLFVIVPACEHDLPERSSEIVDGSCWMKELDDSLLINRISIPGCHDAGTQNVDLAFFSKCQGSSVFSQLNAGYRYLDMRLAVGQQDKAGKWDMDLMHGFTHCRTGAFLWSAKLTLRQVLEQCYEFLRLNPEETIVFAVKQEHGSESVAEFQKVLDSIIEENASMWYLDQGIPMLGEARGKLVLMRRYEDLAGLGNRSGIPLIWKNQDGHQDVTLDYDRQVEEEYTLYVQDRYEYGTKDKWNAFERSLKEVPAFMEKQDVFINFLSTKGTAAYGHPYKYARALNKKIVEREQPGFWGWTIVDFGSSSVARHIYSANF